MDDLQAVKSVTYVPSKVSPTVSTSPFQPVKLTTTTFAYTPTGERIPIKGLTESVGGSTVQVRPYETL